MKFGFLCSAGGAPIFSALDILFKLDYINKDDVKILVDRDCNALYAAINKNIEVKKIEWTNKEAFSKEACDYLSDCDAVLLLYSRLVSEELYSNMPTFNIHPALLPAFQGQSPLNRAYKFGVRFLGCSLHMVDHTIDNGNLIAQVVRPVPIGASFDKIKNIAYLEKTYLVLLYIELLKEKMLKIDVKNNSFNFLYETSYNGYANPSIKKRDIEKEYVNLYRTEQNRTEQNRTEQNRTVTIFNSYNNLLFYKSQAAA